MKIAFVSQPFDIPLPSMGGPGTSIDIWSYNLAQGLIERGHEVIVYGPGSAYGMRLHTEESQGIHYRAMRAVRLEQRINEKLKPILVREQNPFKPFYLSSWFSRFYIEQVALDLKNQTCQVVQISNFCQFAPTIRRHNPDISIVVSMHCDWLSQLDAAILAQYLESVDLVTGCSDHVSSGAENRFERLRGRARTLYNGVNVERFRIMDDLQKDARKTIVFVGRVSPEKGIHDLIKAFVTVHDHVPDAYLKIIGNYYPTHKSYIVDVSDDPLVQDLAQYYDPRSMDADSYWDYLHQLVPDHMKDRVEFTGGMPHHDIVQQMKEAHVFALASLSEAFGIPIVEAMACRVPCVVTSTGGMKEIVKDGKTGYIVPPANPDALATALIKVLENEDESKNMGIAGEQRVRDCFTWDRSANTLIQYYEQLQQAR